MQRPLNRFLLLALFLPACLCGYAQKGQASLRGTVVNVDQHPVLSATVSLLNGRDSSLVRFAVSDSAGRYAFDHVGAGSYLVSATSIGFQKKFSALLQVPGTADTLAVELLSLLPEERSMKGVTVVARAKPPIEIKADRLVLNVASSINATGSNALELLRKSPGVQVDDDDILLNGKNRIAVYIDGKPTYMSGHDLTTYLANIQSSSIESIEIINNPSARMDAAGAGSINIRLKKNLNYGLNADLTATLSLAHFPKADEALNMNYRNKKLNVFGNYSRLDARYRNWSNFYRRQLSKGNLTTFDQHSINDQDYHTNNYKAGADFFLSAKTTLGFMFNGASNSNPMMVTSTTSIFSQPSKIDSVLQADNSFQRHFDRASYNLNYQYQDTSGHTFNIDADYNTIDNRSSSYQPNTYYNDHGLEINREIFKIATATRIVVKSARADYEQRLLGGQFSAGAKISHVDTHNDFRYFDVAGNYDTLNNNRSNLFVYDEIVGAAYLNYLRNRGKWTIQLGLRGEQTKSKGDLITHSVLYGRTVDTTYLNLFPSGSVNYRLNERNSLGFSYSRRIDRPAYAELNPFETPLDVLTVSKGNPFLRPQYTDNVLLNYVYKTLSTSLGYSHTLDRFTQVLDTLSNGRSIQTFQNIHAQNVLSLNVIAQFPVKKWWYNFLSVNTYRTRIKGPLNKGYLDLRATSLNVYASETFSLPKDWRIELSGFYNAPAVNGTVRNRSFGNVDLGVQKKVLQNNGSLRISVTDIFYTLNNRGTIDFQGLYVRGYIHWESRQLKLSFNYRFGNRNVKSARNRTTSAEEEKRRIRD